MSEPQTILPLIISAPFGNYIQPTGATATLGTFTAMARGGRVWRILKTVRYYPRLKAWINQIGLRNPGIDWLVDKVNAGRVDVADKIVSIHGFDDAQWYTLLEKTAALKPAAIELNMSCPNVGEINWPGDLFSRAVATGVRVIVKLPPVNYDLLFAQAYDAQVRWYHCCNTLPTPRGGISGTPLKPVALQCIRDLCGRHDDLVIIGGGGVRSVSDIDDYLDAGANHIAVGVKTMNPIYLLTHAPLQPLIDHACEKLESSKTGKQEIGKE